MIGLGLTPEEYAPLIDAAVHVQDIPLMPLPDAAAVTAAVKAALDAVIADACGT